MDPPDRRDLQVTAALHRQRRFFAGGGNPDQGEFGGLRFYVGKASAIQHDLIRAAEELSYRTCETCGAVGQLYDKAISSPPNAPHMRLRAASRRFQRCFAPHHGHGAGERRKGR